MRLEADNSGHNNHNHNDMVEKEYQQKVGANNWSNRRRMKREMLEIKGYQTNMKNKKGNEGVPREKVKLRALTRSTT